ncbi:sulfotransferase [Sphingomonas sp. LY160]|uniref:sulfotransferase family protein n=1 Tax=Sphingomonas sp. LY160 TaxID=3095342 RepID=UPI002ADEEC8E|nr:sulfotransferase [Sphingomonas sp. LY160]MEA1071665.1 sulfotransferase [Sphingomonas sp. LY160]
MTIDDLPRFVFIVGAPRCGTTTLAGFLKGHPRVCFPLVKEPHFFLQHDTRGLDAEALRRLVEREYLDRFYAQCNSSHDTGVDGSVSYLYAPDELLPALSLWPDAKFVIALRDPMTMLPSLHQRLKYTGDETIERFDKAWAAIPDRVAGRRIPRSCLEPRWLRYDEAGRFGTYVERFFDVIGRERCFVSLFDDLVADPEGQYRAMCDFVGLEPVAGTKMKSRRESKGFRYGWLQRLLKRPPAAARNYLAGKHFAQRERSLDDDDSKVTEKIFSIRKRLLRWNRVPLVKQPIPVEIQQEIRDRLSGEIEHLGRMLGRDLSHWLEVREGRLG